jgi:hypothetical protein
MKNSSNLMVAEGKNVGVCPSTELHHKSCFKSKVYKRKANITKENNFIKINLLPLYQNAVKFIKLSVGRF